MSLSASSALAGKTALITGAAKRVGAAIATALHAEGANVVLHCHHSLDDAQVLMRKLNGLRPDSVRMLQADLLDARARDALLANAVQTFGRLDLLVNNASTFYPTRFGSITDAQFDDLIGTNLRAPLFLSQAAAPQLREHCGLIVNLIDVHAKRPLPDYLVYCCAKAGLSMLTTGLARELGPQVRVNGIAPGPILWPESGADEKLRQKIIERTPLKRMGTPEDIAKAVRFFAVDAPYATGQVLAIDGGRSIAW